MTEKSGFDWCVSSNATVVTVVAGATSGQIEEEELFYLRSRGIPLKDAQRLIVHGFLDEVLERLNDTVLATKMSRLLHERFDLRHS